MQKDLDNPAVAALDMVQAAPAAGVCNQTYIMLTICTQLMALLVLYLFGGAMPHRK
jgi:hypothetical protein